MDIPNSKNDKITNNLSKEFNLFLLLLQFNLIIKCKITIILMIILKRLGIIIYKEFGQ